MKKISNLSSTLKEKYGMSQAEAEKFVSLMFDVVNDALHYDKIAKVKGLGTFKVTPVSSRESVDVNTGERIIIEGREKISFTPELSMKNRVNSPFSQFETVVINDDVDFSSIDKKYNNTFEEDTTDEDEDNVQTDEETTQSQLETEAEVETKMEDETAVNTEAEVETLATTQIAAPTEGMTEKPTEEPKSNEPKADAHTHLLLSASQLHILNSDEVMTAKEKDTESVVDESENQTDSDVIDAIADTDNNKKEEYYNELIDELQTNVEHKHRLVTVLSLLLVVLLLICVGGFFYAKNQMEIRDNRIAFLTVPKKTSATNKPVAKKPQVQAVKAKTDTPNVAKQDTQSVAKKAEKPTIPTETLQYDNDPRVKTGAYIITGVAQTVVAREGQTLKSISKSFLGPDMECYVEALNGKKSIKKGDEVKIPALKHKKSK